MTLLSFDIVMAEENERLLRVVNRVLTCELSSVAMCYDEMFECMNTLVTIQSDEYLEGQAYLAKGIIYKNIGDYEYAISELKRAKSLLFSKDMVDSYIMSTLCLAEVYVKSEQYDSALFQMEVLREYYDELTKEQRAFYLDICLCLSGYYKYLISEKIREYLQRVDEEDINWGLLLKILPTSSELSNTFNVCKKVIKSNRFVSKAEARFLNSICENAQECVDDSSRIKLSYIEFMEPSGFGTVVAIRELEKTFNQKCRNKKLICVFSLLIVMLLSLFAIGYIMRDKYLLEIALLREERDKAKLVRRRLQFSSTMLCRVDERLRLLDNYILAAMSGNYINEAELKLKTYLEDKHTFLQSTVDSYLIVHPQFIRYLRDQNLTDDEVAYCCMYVSGFKGKVIASYLGWKRGYDKSVKLREKLNIKGAHVNIDTFLMRKLSEFDN